jgi:hypothetical protein
MKETMTQDELNAAVPPRWFAAVELVDGDVVRVVEVAPRKSDLDETAEADACAVMRHDVTVDAVVFA